MSINERLRFLRTTLGLTTRAFGAAINITGGAITNMEKGRREITERTIRDICREYNISYDWFTEGKEPMFDDALQGLDVPEEVRELSDAYSRLGEIDKDIVRRLIDSLIENPIQK